MYLFRIALSPFKVLLRPFAVRLRMLMSAAVDMSQLNADVVQMRVKLDQAHREMGHLIAAVETAAARDDRVQLGVDALRRGQECLEALCRDQQSLADEAVVRSNAILVRTSELLALSGVFVSRADMLAGRQTIPLGSDILMRIRGGLLLVPTEDSSVVTAVLDSIGRLEPGMVKVIIALLRQGDCVIDVGANIGLVTLPAARAVGPTGHVVAVEPSARIADLLKKTSVLNLGPDRVSVHRLAAGEEAGTAVLHIGATAGYYSLLPPTSSARSETVEVARLDDLIEPGRSIRLVKINAEGFELAVWRGMKRIVDENLDLIVVVEFGPEHLQRAGTTVDAWLDAFQAPGFTIFEIDEATGSLQRLRPREALHQVVSLNLVLLRRSASSYPMLDFA